MKTKLYFLFLTLFFWNLTTLLLANAKNHLYLDSLSGVLQEDNYFYSRLDSLWAQEQLSFQQLESDTAALNKWSYSEDSIPFFSDSVIAYRLSILDQNTPFSLVYNKAVQTQINIYANTYRQHVSKMLGKANYYFPLFESKLDQFDLPLEFKYLAIVESALKPQARSRSAATGLWQFMYTTGKIYDLKVSSYIDER